MTHIESMFQAIGSSPLGRMIRVLLMVYEVADFAGAPTPLELPFLGDVRQQLVETVRDRCKSCIE